MARSRQGAEATHRDGLRRRPAGRAIARPPGGATSSDVLWSPGALGSAPVKPIVQLDHDDFAGEVQTTQGFELRVCDSVGDLRWTKPDAAPENELSA